MSTPALAHIKAKLDATAAECSAAERRLATLALLTLATMTRELYPNGAYLLLAETDQNDSGELWVQEVQDAERNTIADSQEYDDDPVAYYLHASNTDSWSAFATDLSKHGRGSVGEYLLDVNEVLAEVQLDA